MSALLEDEIIVVCGGASLPRFAEVAEVAEFAEFAAFAASNRAGP
jgi:hypothetical protein